MKAQGRKLVLGAISILLAGGVFEHRGSACTAGDACGGNVTCNSSGPNAPAANCTDGGSGGGSASCAATTITTYPDGSVRETAVRTIRTPICKLPAP